MHAPENARNHTEKGGLWISITFELKIAAKLLKKKNF